MPDTFEVDGPGHPRPQLQRDGWVSVDGPWDFAIDPAAAWTSPGEVQWDRTITVPFTPETPASGVARTDFFHACWYRRTVSLPALADGKRLLLHFGAVDYRATVWLNGRLAAEHEGGYTPFAIDSSASARPRRRPVTG